MHCMTVSLAGGGAEVLGALGLPVVAAVQGVEKLAGDPRSEWDRQAVDGPDDACCLRW